METECNRLQGEQHMCFYILDVIVSASKCVAWRVSIIRASSDLGFSVTSSPSVILVCSFRVDSRARQEATEATVSKLAWYLALEWL